MFLFFCLIMLNRYNKKRKALEPLIATILLIVVSVILVTIVLTWGKEFSTSSLNKTTNILYEKSDLTNFISIKSIGKSENDFSRIEIKNLHSTETATITGYKILVPNSKFKFLETSEFSLEEPVTLSPGQINFLNLECTPAQEFNIQLLTNDGKYISTKYSNPNYIAGSCIKDIATTATHTCAILANGKIKCWGGNWYGQLGDGTTEDSNLPVYVLDINNAEKLYLDGYYSSCALLEDKTIKCWGQNDFGQLGDGSDIDNQSEDCEQFDEWSYGCSVPRVVVGINNATDIVYNGYFGCTLLEDKTVNCWGYNYYGQLGNGTTSNSSVPVEVTGIDNAIKISIGVTHACALLEDKTIKCWGYNETGALGNGDFDSSSTPDSVLNIDNAIDISLGSNFSCALLENKTINCWGLGADGQLGNGGTDNSNIPVLVSGINNAVSFSDKQNTAVIDFKSYECALLDDGKVKCWGKNFDGELGNGESETYSATPTYMCESGAGENCVPQTNISKLYVNAGEEGSNTCVLLNDNTMKCSGNNYYNQLGNNDVCSDCYGSCCVNPTTVYNLSNIYKSTTTYGYANCVILKNGDVKCWGYNAYGQLGDGTTEEREIPVLVDSSLYD